MTPVDLAPYLNARAATTDAERPRGGFNAWGNSFPAEELPFGGSLTLRGIAFHLVSRDGLDHVEALGQTIALRAPARASALALLACGEMGPQQARVSVPAGAFDVIAGGWLADDGTNVDGAFAATHLHYAGGYELARLRPVLWPVVIRWPSPAWITSIALSANPLFHIAAMTLLD